MKLMNMIYDGKVYPGEQVVSKDPEYKKASCEINTLMQKLEPKLETILSEEDYAEVEAVCDLYAIMQDLQCKAYFNYGLSMGLRLMCEAQECPYIHDVEKIENIKS